MGKWIAILILIAVIGVALTGVVIVDEREHAIVTRFGRPTAVYSEAGLYFKWPAPLARVTRIDKRVLFTGTEPSEFLTADKKNVVVSGFVSWRVGDPLEYMSTLKTREMAESRLASLVVSELGSEFGDVPFDRLVPTTPDRDGLGTLENAVFESCRAVAQRDFGIEIESFGVRRVSFPRQNQESVFARMRAERARIASGYRSEGEAEAQTIRAEADRERADILASAEADAARTRGEGEAEAARIYADAYGAHQEFYTFWRTLESYEKVLGDNTTLVLPADSPFLELLMSRTPSERAPAANAATEDAAISPEREAPRQADRSPHDDPQALDSPDDAPRSSLPVDGSRPRKVE